MVSWRKAATVAFFTTVQNEGERKVERKIAFYNLDMIICVGYRVHSYRGVQFRIWAAKGLKEYIVNNVGVVPRTLYTPLDRRCSQLLFV